MAAVPHPSSPPPPDLVTSTDGVRVAVHDLGGTGPVVVICHATGFCGRTYEPLRAALGDDVHAIATDVRAHGDAVTPSDAPLMWDGFGRDLAAALTAVSPDRPVLAIGHSMGGAAIVMAELLRPGSIAAAFLFEPIVFPASLYAERPPGDSPIVVATRRRRRGFASRREAYDNFAAKPPLDTLHPDALDAYVRHGFTEAADGTVTLKCDPDDEATVFGNSFHPTFDRLGEIATPITVARGGEPDVPTTGVAALVAEALPEGTLQTFSDLTHLGPLEDPAGIAAAARTALGL